MRIGVCAPVSEIAAVQGMGFDYLEWSVTEAAMISDEEFTAVKRSVDGSAIKVEACNCFFPGGMKIVGPQADPGAIADYVEMAIRRVAALGASIVVVGSGAARAVPDGWDREEGLRQFCEALRVIGRACAPYGVTAAVEPLNRGETNIVNSVGEGLSLVRTANHPNVRLLADFFHMRVEREPMNALLDTGGTLAHLHIANSNGRIFPKDPSEDDYESFFRALKRVSYGARISVEAGTTDFSADAPRALALLRSLDHIH